MPKIPTLLVQFRIFQFTEKFSARLYSGLCFGTLIWYRAISISKYLYGKWIKKIDLGYVKNGRDVYSFDFEFPRVSWEWWVYLQTYVPKEHFEVCTPKIVVWVHPTCPDILINTDIDFWSHLYKKKYMLHAE